MICLDKDNFIARGTNRACFLNPLDNTKCIKITV
ncbi:MAG: hypothetical protein K8R44_03680, partial [Sulfurimonas sp.]|nr:hypothetical protein [Sulfurimonas sp.]